MKRPLFTFTVLIRSYLGVKYTLKARIYLVCFFLFLAWLGQAQTLPRAEEAYIDSVMQAYYKPHQPGAVILVAKSGKPLFRKAYGVASLEPSVPNQPEYCFHIASMAKQFTAVCILQLAQQGKLSLQEDIRTYLPAYNTHSRKITLEHLLTHTSGIPSFTEKRDFSSTFARDRSREETLQYFMQDSLLFEPGTNWSYSNSGYFLAALIVEKVSGMPLPAHLQEHIFTPLAMSNTYFGPHHKEATKVVTGYLPAGKGTYKATGNMSWDWQLGVGGISSTVDDLLKWDEALYSEKLLKREWQQKAWKSFVLTTGQKTNYGYGWTTNEFKGVQWLGHPGSMPGFLSYGIRIPAHHLYLVILSNQSLIRSETLSSTILLRLLDQSLATPSKRKLEGKQREAYTGVYQVQRMRGRIATNQGTESWYNYITLTNDTLFSQLPGESKEPLLPMGSDLFVRKQAGSYVRFKRDKQQNIVSLELYNQPIHLGPYELEPKTSLPLPKEKIAITLLPQQLKGLEGKYVAGDYVFTITTQEKRIYLQRPLGGGEREELFAENEHKFFLKNVDASVEFTKDSTGQVDGLLFKRMGLIQAKKVE